MRKVKELTEKQIKIFRYYRLVTIWVLSLIFILSIWGIMINNIEWTFSDVAYPTISLMMILLAGMFGNANNNFPVFHIRGIRITRERLISILLGILFPIFFVIYIMVTDESFMSYVSNISLHNFITLTVYAIPVFLFITLIVYFGYLVVAPKTKRKSIPQYKEEVEKSLDAHKTTAINIVLLLSFISLWIKISLTEAWYLKDIIVELISIISIFTIRILANKDNKLPITYRQGKLLDKSFFLALLVPYLVVICYYAISRDFRVIISVLEIRTIISTLVYLLPLFVFGAIIVEALLKLEKHCDKNDIKELKITKKVAKRNENILISVLLTAVAIILIFIYIITKIITSVDLEILLQMWTILIPLAVIIYIVLYYSIRDINR